MLLSLWIFLLYHRRNCKCTGFYGGFWKPIVEACAFIGADVVFLVST